MFAVPNSRAATSKRFGELALFTAVKEAIRTWFVEEDPGEFTFGGADNPFATETMRVLLASLARGDKLICLIFDQFEELLYKDELEPVFDEMQALCNAVDEAQENVVIGFSWKTDGTIPPEHKAYHLWHSLADRRLFELTPFTANEVTTALNRFAAELGQSLAPRCAVYSKITVRATRGFSKSSASIYSSLLPRRHKQESDVLVRSLSIQELFQKRYRTLSQIEYACIKQISQEAPAEFF